MATIQDDAFGYEGKIHGLCISKAQTNGSGQIICELKGETEAKGLDDLMDDAWLYAAIEWAINLAKGDKKRLDQIALLALEEYERQLLEKGVLPNFRVVK